jgi:SAM-dependent methyltransferase
MSPTPFDATDLRQIYERRFDAGLTYRNEVWKILTSQFFQRFVPRGASVLDLGCGYGEFINNIECGAKHAMDLNPSARGHLQDGIHLLQQSCAEPWKIENDSLDVVFTSNFFEHLPDKAALSLTLREAWRCLKPEGQIICLGPNIKFLPGKYWDFWDHHLPLTEQSLAEGLELIGFKITHCYDRFLPYTMVDARRYPMAFVSLYLRVPLAWKILGRQFLVIGRKPIRP